MLAFLNDSKTFVSTAKSGDVFLIRIPFIDADEISYGIIYFILNLILFSLFSATCFLNSSKI